MSHTDNHTHTDRPAAGRLRGQGLLLQGFLALVGVYGLATLGRWTARMARIGFYGNTLVGVLGIVAVLGLVVLMLPDLIRRRPAVVAQDGAVTICPGWLVAAALRAGVLALLLAVIAAALLQYRGELAVLDGTRHTHRLLVWLPILGAVCLVTLIALVAKWAKGEEVFGSGLRLTPQGISGYGRRGGDLAWSEIAAVTVGTDALRGSRVGPRVAVLHRAGGGEVVRVDTSRLIGAALTAAVIGFYLDHPHRRGELADGSAAARIAARDFTDGTVC